MTNHSHSRVLVIVIDPQKGFCSTEGTLARVYGKNELSKIHTTVDTLTRLLNQNISRYLITSEYQPAQFTAGETHHPLSSLCVPNKNIDCEIINELADIDFNYHTVKHHQDAMSVEEFFTHITQCIEAGIDRIIFSGFLLEHCVKATALSLSRRLVNTNAKVYICTELCASRLEKYKNGTVASTLTELEENHIQLINMDELNELIHS